MLKNKIPATFMSNVYIFIYFLIIILLKLCNVSHHAVRH